MQLVADHSVVFRFFLCVSSVLRYQTRVEVAINYLVFAPEIIVV